MSATHTPGASAEAAPLVSWGSALAHGTSQIFFQANVWTGLLILIAFVVGDWRMAILVVIGSLASSLAGLFFGVKRADIWSGMHGFCGALVGAATFAALGGADWHSYAIALAGGVVCAPVTLAIIWLFSRAPLKPLNLPYTTAPFCIVASLIFVTTMPLHPAANEPVFGGTAVEAVGQSLLLNVSQVVLVDNMWAGAIILLGLLIANWKVGVAGILGSILGSVSALVMGVPLEHIAQGLAGYSSVLTAIAFAAVFMKGTWEPWIFAVIGAIVTAGVTVLMNLGPAPVYTWPYILTTWVGLILVYAIPRVERRWGVHSRKVGGAGEVGGAGMS